MGWEVGYDERWSRDIGYGIPSLCDHPNCKAEIDRGLAYVCGGEPYGGDHGCGLYFCDKHMSYGVRKDGPHQMCEQCVKRRKPFTPKPDLLQWTYFKMVDPSWEKWRKSNKLTPKAIADLENGSAFETGLGYGSDEEKSALNVMMASALDPDKNEATAYPYWIIIDPKVVRLASYQNRSHYIACAITGPFFSREAADERLKCAAHHYSKHSIVYCASGHASSDWVKLLKMAKEGVCDTETA